ncbi:MAG: glycosyltransferase family 39 protein [Lachnospiraceae bacterium]|nr:glycosyltransferase family 39 protein [Lachnospiraceae bacterium]
MHTKYRIKILLIMIIAVASRLIGIGVYPVGIHADEAYAGYEAFAILHDGMDSWGYHNPVYLTVWGSGMSVLESLLMMPFIKLGGLSLTMVRLPQMILGVLSVLVLYLLLKKISSPQMALWAAFLMAVCPWHIMMSRWGLDANLAPAFILFAMYFSVLGLEKERYFILAALFWGISLYTYALTWIFVPAFLLLSALYCIKYNKIQVTKTIWIAIGTLGFTALPLMMFVAVNKGILPEIKTQYFSIPRLVEFRSDELTFSNIAMNIRDLLRIYIKQNDYSLMNTIPYFGLYYLFSAPFMLLGSWRCLSDTFSALKNKKFGYTIFLLFWILICAVTGTMRSMNAYRANVMNLAVLILIAKGICWLCWKFRKKWLNKILLLLYLISFVIFEAYYFTAYQEEIKDIQKAGLEQALAYALDLRSVNDIDLIHVTDSIAHPQILFYAKCPVEVFRSTVKWKNYPAKWVYAESFDCFVWDEEEMDGEIFLISEQDLERYAKAGYQTVQFGAYGVAYW